MVMSAASCRVNPSYSSEAISTEVRVETGADNLDSSLLHSFLVISVIAAIFSRCFIFTNGNMYFNNSASSSLLSSSISMIVNLSIKALSITLVLVYSFPILAVAIKVTPSATLIVACVDASSSLKYL